MALLPLVLPKPSPDIDRDRCIQLCLVHDLAESLVGDITPFDGVSRAEKRTRESSAMGYMAALGPGKEHLLALW